MGSSQLALSLHRYCRICFPTNMTGATNPKGLYIELTVENIPCLVKDLSTVILN